MPNLSLFGDKELLSYTAATNRIFLTTTAYRTDCLYRQVMGIRVGMNEIIKKLNDNLGGEAIPVMRDVIPQTQVEASLQMMGQGPLRTWDKINEAFTDENFLNRANLACQTVFPGDIVEYLMRTFVGETR